MIAAAHHLSQSRWLGPGILVGSALLLALLGGSSILYWILLVLALALASVGTFSHSRWLIALPGVFIVSILAFFVDDSLQPLGSLAILVTTAGLAGIALWVFESGHVHNVALAYVAGLGLGELFLLLRFWPVNSPSKALILTSAAFLLFEFVDRRSRGVGFHAILGSVGLVAVSIIAIVLTADWQMF